MTLTTNRKGRLLVDRHAVYCRSAQEVVVLPNGRSLVFLDSSDERVSSSETILNFDFFSLNGCLRTGTWYGAYRYRYY
jgi:hypothetical protein